MLSICFEATGQSQVQDLQGLDGFRCLLQTQKSDPELQDVAGDHYAHVPRTRAAALQILQALDVKAYAKDRNFLDGSVSRLSTAIEHGLMTPQEVVAVLQQRFQNSEQAQWTDAYRFIQQLCWREFFQERWRRDVNAPFKNLQDYKTGWQDSDYQKTLPVDIVHAKTESALINQLIMQLQTEGYLHNHGRLYLASYLVHWRRVHWLTGANWMFGYLLDGNLASNHFSWQWVASTAAPKPYIFNLENAQQFAATGFDTSAQNNAVFDASYEQLQTKLFPNVDVR